MRLLFMRACVRVFADAFQSFLAHHLRSPFHFLLLAASIIFCSKIPFLSGAPFNAQSLSVNRYPIDLLCIKCLPISHILSALCVFCWANHAILKKKHNSTRKALPAFQQNGKVHTQHSYGSKVRLSVCQPAI